MIIDLVLAGYVSVLRDEFFVKLYKLIESFEFQDIFDGILKSGKVPEMIHLLDKPF